MIHPTNRKQRSVPSPDDNDAIFEGLAAFQIGQRLPFLEIFTPDFEVYSINVVFLSLPGRFLYISASKRVSLNALALSCGVDFLTR